MSAMVFTAVVTISAVQGQGGSGGQIPAYKLAFEATERALQATREAVTPAPKDPSATIPPHCPNAFVKAGIFPNVPMGPLDYRGFVNIASVIRNDMYYMIWAGSPYDARNIGLIR